MISEETFLFGQDCALVGVICNPDAESANQDLPGIVLLNAGVIHRVGPNRLYVKIARELAQLGFTILRFDFSGIGDSPVRTDNVPFGESSMKETKAAMDYLQDHKGMRRFVLVGICSGAANSFRIASIDPRIDGAALINIRGYHSDLALKVRAYLRKFFRFYWKSLIANPKNLLKACRRSFSQATWRSIFRIRSRQRIVVSNNARVAHSAKEAVLSLTGRGVRLLLAYSESDVGLDYLHLTLGRKLHELTTTGSLRLEIIPQADHAFTLLRNQEHLIRAIRRWAEDLFAPTLAAPAEGLNSAHQNSGHENSLSIV